jgi:hypothetical protein
VLGRGFERCRYFSISSGVTPLSAPERKRVFGQGVGGPIEFWLVYVVHRAIAPPEGYTQSDPEPPGKAGMSTDRIDRSPVIETEALRTRRSRVRDERSIPRWTGGS